MKAFVKERPATAIGYPIMMRYHSLLDIFKRIDENVCKPVILCIIGSSATILLGQQERRTEDVDVWLQASEFDLGMIIKAVERAGLLWDPKEEFQKGDFVRIVRPGVAQVPGWDPAARTWFGKEQDVLWKGRFLTVTSPPPASIIVSKLIRFDDSDLQDCIWLLENFHLNDEYVMNALHMLPKDRMSHAEENWIYLKSLLSFRCRPWFAEHC